MRRREFIMLMGSATAWPLTAHAQESGRIYRLGVMTPSPRTATAPITAFFDELRMLGFVEEQNLKVAAMVCAMSNFPLSWRRWPNRRPTLFGVPGRPKSEPRR
jgi:hypothetical protein